jgi:hypothetical protein
MCNTWCIHNWQVYVQTGVIFKHLTQVSVVTLRSDLEKKEESKKRHRKKRVKAGLHKFFQKHRSDLKMLCARDDMKKVTYS